MSKPVPNFCANPGCQNESGIFALCPACRKALAAETARRTLEAGRQKAHDTLDGLIARGVEWLFGPPPGPRA